MILANHSPSPRRYLILNREVESETGLPHPFIGGLLMMRRTLMTACAIGTLAACGVMASAQTAPPQGAANFPLHWCVSGAEEPNINFSGLPIQRGRSEIFYEQHIGKYPRIWTDPATGRHYTENEGIPQKTNWPAHLAKVRRDLDARIPDVNWDGTAILDFEGWHPNWEMGVRDPMKALSRAWVRTRFPALSTAQVEARAHEEFEAAGMDFMVRTIQECKALRPHAKWGFYGFPYVFYPANMQEEFRPIFNAVDAFFPPVYAVNYSVPDTQTPGPWQRYLSDYTTRISQQMALTRQIAPTKPIFPLVWIRYHDMNHVYTDQMLNDLDLPAMFRQPWLNGAQAVIFWDYIQDQTDRDEYNAFFAGRGGNIIRNFLTQANPPPSPAAPPAASPTPPIQASSVIRTSVPSSTNKAAKSAPSRVLTAVPVAPGR